MTATDTIPEPTESAQNKGGAPKLNGNALAHGLKSRRLIPLGALPPGCSHIRKLCSVLRAQLESAVVAAKGQVSLIDAATINTAVRHERAAQLAQKWLKDFPDCPLDTRITINASIPKLSENRDKAIRALDLPRPADNSDPWASLDRLRNAGQPYGATPKPSDDPQVILPAETSEGQPGGLVQ